ncbi:MAG: TIGR02281 family clan AA aspartic protease [Pseudomonadota bacterium]
MAMSHGARRGLSEAAVWLTLAGIAVAAFVYFKELKAVTRSAFGLTLPTPTQTVEAPSEPRRAFQVELKPDKRGHHVTRAAINGRDIRVLVDTGATIVALTAQDAERAGVYVRRGDFTHRVSTANGTARAAPVTLERVRIGDIVVRNVRGVVLEEGRLKVTLLGMSFLRQLSKVEMRRGVLTLEQ